MKTSTAAGVTTTYSYNGLGERVKKANASSTVYFAYDEAGHLLGEYDAEGDLIEETVWLGDVPVAVLKPNGGSGISVFYIHTDHLNTPRRITRPNDNSIVWRWDSGPFGATAANEDPDGDTVVSASLPRPVFSTRRLGCTTTTSATMTRRPADTSRAIRSDSTVASTPSRMGWGIHFRAEIHLGSTSTEERETYYSDRAPSGACETAVFSGDYIVAWVPCDAPATPRVPGPDDGSYCPTPEGTDAVTEEFDWKGAAWDVLGPDWTWLVPEAKAVKALGVIVAVRRFSREKQALLETIGAWAPPELICGPTAS
jgi:YD repeat-containing protein